jgi:hypothetical protein
VEVAEEDWCTKLSAALTAQLASFYEPESLEKAFALRALGHVTRLLTSDQLILDNMSALYLAVTHTAMESACAKAFGNFKINYLCMRAYPLRGEVGGGWALEFTHTALESACAKAFGNLKTIFFPEFRLI